MSKNITRKGLALAVASALGVAAFATPAHAVVPVSIDPTNGTGYTTILGSDFSLTSYLTNGAINAPSDSFKWIITDANGVVDTSVTGTLDNTESWSTPIKKADGVTTDTSIIVVDEGTAFAGLPGNSLQFGVTSAANTSVTVQGFVDNNGNNKIDAGESASALKTVNFVTFKSAGLTTNLVQPKLSDTALVADITFANTDVNIATVDNTDFRVDFGYYTTAGILTPIQGNVVSSAVVASNKLHSTSTVGFSVTAGRIYSAQAEYNDVTNGWGSAGDENKKTAPAAFADTITVPSAKASSDVIISSANTYHVREGVKDFSLSSAVTVATAASAAGVSVTAHVANVVAPTTGNTITIGGTVFGGTKLSGDITLTTGADGKVVIPVSASAGKAGESFQITSIKINDVPDNAASHKTTTVNVAWVAAGIDDIYNEFWGLGYDYVQAAGGNVDAPFSVFDNFGTLVKDGKTYRLKVTVNAPTVSGAEPNDQVLVFPVVNGRADVNFTDKSAGGDTSVSVVLQSYSSTTLEWSAVSPAVSDSFTLHARTVAPTAVKTIEVQDYWFHTGNVYGDGAGEVSTLSLSQDKVSTSNGFVDGVFKDTPAADGLNWMCFYITDADGNYISYGNLTVSSPGVQFGRNWWWDNSPQQAGNPTITKLDTITVPFATNGYTDGQCLQVASNVSGKHTFTITAGGVTKTLVLTVDSPTVGDATAVALTAPSAVVPGDTTSLKAQLVDQFGNKIVTNATDFSLKVTGGATTWTNVDDTTTSDGTHADLANGVLTTSISPVAADLGNLTVTATYDVLSDGSATGHTSDDIVKTATIVVGAPKLTVTLPASAQAGKAVDASVTVVDAAGKALAGRVVSVSNTGAGYTSVSTVTTDANGKANFKLIGGASDTGLSTVTATLAGGTGSANTTFGVTDANINKAGKRVTVDWTYAAGKRVVIYRDGVQIRNFVASSDASDSFSFNLKKGTHKITVKVGGVTVDSQSYKIK